MSRKMPPGLRIGDCRSLVVTASFAGPSTVALDSYWPVLLDGLLTAVVQDQHPLRRATETVPLPLTWYQRDVGAQWHWAASVGVPLGVVASQAAAWHSRWERDPGPEVVTCSGVAWRAVGDAGEVADLVAGVGDLGNRRHHAVVSTWQVDDAGEADESWALWLDSGLIARPVAARAATGLGVPDAGVVDGAVRPPYWRPPSVTEDGTFDRAWRPVLAPWTRRPGVEIV